MVREQSAVGGFRVLQLEVGAELRLLSGPIILQPRVVRGRIVYQKLCVLGHAVPQDDILDNSGSTRSILYKGWLIRDD